jgi:hypothetical protein
VTETGVISKKFDEFSAGLSKLFGRRIANRRTPG